MQSAEIMKEAKTENLTIRIAPASKRGLAIVADREGRSMANSIEWLVRGYFDGHGLEWPPEELVLSEKPTKAALATDKANNRKAKK
jgi:hypothetical protein